MSEPVSEQALDALFRDARSFSYWQDREVSDEQLRQLYDLTKMGPTSANSCPARFLFIRSSEAKERLKPSLSEGNVHKAMSAPVVAVIAMDMQFYEQLPRLFPHTDARSWYEGKPAKIEETAFRNSTLQGAYLMLAARALGLDCGPMSGFDGKLLDETFFPDGRLRSNFLCCIGYGNRERLHERQPRLDFDEACELL